jgi:hypothetical protein
MQEDRDARPRQYILEGHTPVPVAEAAWFLQDLETRRVALDRGDDWEVSTVFVGVPLGWDGAGRPLLFEVRCPEADDLQAHYATWDEAAAVHAAVVAKLRQRLAP